MAKPQARKTLETFNQELAQVHMTGQWIYEDLLNRAIGGPRPKGDAYLWPWKMVHEKLLEACDVVRRRWEPGQVCVQGRDVGALPLLGRHPADEVVGEPLDDRRRQDEVPITPPAHARGQPEVVHAEHEVGGVEPIGGRVAITHAQQRGRAEVRPGRLATDHQAAAAELALCVLEEP